MFRPTPQQIPLVNQCRPVSLEIEFFLANGIVGASVGSVAGSRREALVKWKRYTKPTWEPLTSLDMTVLDTFEKRCRPSATNHGPF